MANGVRNVGGLVALLVLAVSCGSSGSDHPTSQSSTSPSPSSDSGQVTVVAIGDSDATGIGDPSGRGWVGRYGDLLKRNLGQPVEVNNLAREGETSDQLRTDVADTSTLRATLKNADVVLIGIGGADLNAGDAALDAGSCNGRDCYRKLLHRFGANMAAIAAEVKRLAPSAVLRAMSLPNGFPGAGKAFPPSATADVSRYQVLAERSLVCRAMRDNGGRCVDVVRAFNGPSANEDAYAAGYMTKDPCCYPSGKGQQLIARLLLRTGVEGLATG